jgi:hypothetical protein
MSAWKEAQNIAKKYGQEVDESHIQDCLDSYREWLHVRSTCPNCANHSLQQNSGDYGCFNCGATWRVSPSRFNRCYRANQKSRTLEPAFDLPENSQA